MPRRIDAPDRPEKGPCDPDLPEKPVKEPIKEPTKIPVRTR